MLIRNGNIILKSKVISGDLRVKHGVIVEMGPDLLKAPGEEVLDAAGRYIAPGGIDAHTHLDMPCGDITTADGFRCGSLAAIAGGTTTGKQKTVLKHFCLRTGKNYSRYHLN